MTHKEKTLLRHTNDPDALVAQYGQLLDDNVSDSQKRVVLEALWTTMAGFADLGFDIGAGDKFCEKSDVGMDDVVNYICREETAPETVAPPEPTSGKEQT